MYHQLRTWDFIYWEKGLGILTLPWINLFLVDMGLTKELENHLANWTELYLYAKHSYLDSSGRALTSQENWHEDQMRNIHSLNQALTHFREIAGDEAVEDLCLWFYRNYMNHDYLRSVGQWRSILTKAILLNDTSIEKQRLPECITSLMLEIEEVIWWQVERCRLQLLRIPVTYPEPLEEDSAPMEFLTNTEDFVDEQHHGIPIGYPGIVYDRIMDHLTLEALQSIHLSSHAQEAEEWLMSLSDGSRLIDFSILATIGMSVEEDF